MNEIPGFPGYAAHKDGRIWSHKTRKFLKDMWSRGGYRYVHLCVDGKKKSCAVHRLVAMTFIPNPLDKKTVNHLNSKRDDNRVENLEWASYAENSLHGYTMGRINPRRRLTEDEAREIQSCRTKTAEQLAKDFEVSKWTVNKIRQGRTWLSLRRTSN